MAPHNLIYADLGVHYTKTVAKPDSKGFGQQEPYRHLYLPYQHSSDTKPKALAREPHRSQKCDGERKEETLKVILGNRQGWLGPLLNQARGTLGNKDNRQDPSPKIIGPYFIHSTAFSENLEDLWNQMKATKQGR